MRATETFRLMSMMKSGKSILITLDMTVVLCYLMKN